MSGIKKLWVRLQSRTAIVGVAVFVVLATSGIYSLLATKAIVLPGLINGQIPDTQAILQQFVNDPKKGLHWEGLRERLNGPCGKLLEAVDSKGVVQTCTHGPDPAPDGVDARQPVTPYASNDAEVLANDQIACEGDGKSGFRVETIYVHASDKPNRYQEFANSFPVYASNANDIFVKSGNQTGSARSIRFVTDTSCKLIVHNVTVSPGGDDSYGNTVAELKNKGFNRTDRKYMIWMDATVLCGVGGITNDTRPGQENAANGGPSYGRSDSGCWGKSTEAHELIHNIGGVQKIAPNNGSQNQHCNDEWDVMCYKDASQTAMRYICPESEKAILDCNKDDYFNTSTTIPATNYLSKNWNTANSKFLIKGAPGGTNPPTPTPNPTPTPPPTSDTVKPTISIAAPTGTTSVNGTSVTVSANATDNVKVTKVEFRVDSGATQSDTTDPFSFIWDTTKVANGAHNLTLTAYDAAGNNAAATRIVNVQNSTSNPQPPPPTAKPGDVSGQSPGTPDGRTDLRDLSYLLINWGPNATPAKGDVSGSTPGTPDGKIDLRDLSYLLINWG